MPVVFLNRQKDVLINFLKKLRIFVLKYKYRIFIPSTVFAVLLIAPVLLLNLFFDKNEFYKQVLSLSTKNGLLFSSDGVVKGIFSDIIVYNVRIKDGLENSSQPPLLTIPELKIKPNLYRSLLQGRLVIDTWILKDARWKYLEKTTTRIRHGKAASLNY